MDTSHEVTRRQVFSALGAIVVFIGPPFLLLIFPENPLVRFLFGGGYRLFIFYAFAFAGLSLLDRETIRWWARNRKK